MEQIMERKKLSKKIQDNRKIQTIWAFFAGFCDHSTIHGVRYFAEPRRHWTERIWWLVAFGFSLWLCGSSVQSIWLKWHYNPVSVTLVGKEKSISSIPFPTVTICPETKTYRKKFDLNSLVNYTNLSSYNAKEWLQLKSLLHICPQLADDNDVNSFGDDFIDEQIYDVITDMAPLLNDTVIGMKWKNIQELSNMEFVPILTEKGVCFTYNAINSHEIYTDELAPSLMYIKNVSNISYWSLEKGYTKTPKRREYPRRVFNVGKNAGLLVYLQLHHEDLEYLCTESGLGYTIILSAPGEAFKMLRQSFRVPLFEDTHIRIKPKFMSTSYGLRKYSPEERKCYYSSERVLRFFKNYTQNNCEAECISNFTIVECECVKFSMPRDEETKICGGAKIKCYEAAEVKLLEEDVTEGMVKNINITAPFRNMCNCLPACASIEYNADVGHIKYDLEVLRRSLSDEVTSNRVTKLSIFFQDNEVETLKRVETYTYTDFMSICGGLLGLFLGVSVLSIIEFIYYFTLRLFWTVRQSKSENAIILVEEYRSNNGVSTITHSHSQ